jgi:hypothetical protein
VKIAGAKKYTKNTVYIYTQKIKKSKKQKKKKKKNNNNEKDTHAVEIFWRE